MSNIRTNLDIAIKVLGQERLKLLANATAKNVAEAKKLAAAYSKLASAEGRLAGAKRGLNKPMEGQFRIQQALRQQAERTEKAEARHMVDKARRAERFRVAENRHADFMRRSALRDELHGNRIRRMSELSAARARPMSRLSRAEGALRKGIGIGVDVGTGLVVGAASTVAAYRAIGRAAMTALEPVVDFQTAMAQVRIKGNFSEAETRGLGEVAKQQGRTTSFSPIQAANAQIALAASNLTPKQIEQNIPTVLKFSQASGMETEESADFLVNVARQFGMNLNDPGTLNRVGAAIKNAADSSTISERDIQQTLKYAGPIAHVAGQSVEEAVALAAITGNAGIRGSQSGTGVRNFFSSLAKPKGGKITDELLSNIGLNRKDLAEGMKDVPSLLQLMEERMRSKGLDPAKRIALAASLFGQYGMTAQMVMQAAAGTTAEGLPLMNGIQSMVAGIRGNPNALDNAAAIRAASPQGRIDAMNARFETLKITAGEKLLPYMETALSKVIATLEKWEQQAAVSPEFQRRIEEIGELFVALADALRLVVPAMQALAGAMGWLVRFGGEAGTGYGMSTMSEEEKKRASEAAGIPVYGPGQPKGATAGTVSGMSGVWDNFNFEDKPVFDMELEDMKRRLAGYTAGPGEGDGSKMSREPAVVEIKVTTDKGTTAKVTGFKVGSVTPRTSTSVQ